jgi:hypothetical protein
MPKPSALKRAIEAAGSQSELERRLKAAGEEISQQSIALWLKSGIPARWVLPVARAIEFKVTPHDLDRKAYPNPWDGLPADQARRLVLARAA